MFWHGVLLVEHKSFGQDLGKAESQAFRYSQSLIRDNRKDESPRYIIVSDFAQISLHDLEDDKTVTFLLADLHNHIHSFAFIPGYKQHSYEDQDPINVKAVEIMGKLHDALAGGGYTGHQLERFLVRILFCLFAEDTGIFEREAFHLYVVNTTKEDGTDLGIHLARLFDVLNTPSDKRQANLDESLANFPYVNGDLFSENIGFADFNRDMRNALLASTNFDWSRISPAIFGSLFQAVMEPKERRQIGAHYTSEKDILKVVRSLFLDDLQAEFKEILKLQGGRQKAKLEQYHQKICGLRFLDPACGCGNFLVITYRELRQLELDVLKELLKQGTHKGYGPEFQTEFSLEEINRLSRVDVDQMFGIEIKEWPVRISEVALWLMDHQMNLKVSETFGQLYQRLPLRKRPHIVYGNALRLNWKDVIPSEECSYILGNPPFVGAKLQSDEQRADMAAVAGDVDGAGLLDYVTGWYFKASRFIQGTNIVVGFVSTNSITQGEQAGVLWNFLFQRYGIKIHFGHRTFAWESEARGKAHVHVVIVGFGAFDPNLKRIFDYESDHVTVTTVPNISPYLVAGNDRAVTNRTTSVCAAPKIWFGNQPIDGGHFLLDKSEKEKFLLEEPKAVKYLRRFMGAEEFLNGIERWCLWLKDASPSEIRASPGILQRVDAVKDFRLQSKRPATKGLAKTPSLFAFISHPESKYLLIPSVSSEKRHYIPMGFMSPDVVSSNLNLIVPNATLFHFGILSSAMHMAWVRLVCGRLKSDYRYSNRLVYNNFPWPDSLTEKQRSSVEAAAQDVLDARKEFPSSTLADLYDPLSMPPKLAKAHGALDHAVDRCYRRDPFPTEIHRVEFLFSFYEKLTAPLIQENKRSSRRSI